MPMWCCCHCCNYAAAAAAVAAVISAWLRRIRCGMRKISEVILFKCRKSGIWKQHRQQNTKQMQHLSSYRICSRYFCISSHRVRNQVAFCWPFCWCCCIVLYGCYDSFLAMFPMFSAVFFLLRWLFCSLWRCLVFSFDFLFILLYFYSIGFALDSCRLNKCVCLHRMA